MQTYQTSAPHLPHSLQAVFARLSCMASGLLVCRSCPWSSCLSFLYRLFAASMTHHGQICRTFDNERDAGCEEWSLACRPFVEHSTTTALQATDVPFSDAHADDDCRAMHARSQPSMVLRSKGQPMLTIGKVGLSRLGCSVGEHTATPCVLGMRVFVGYCRRLGV